MRIGGGFKISEVGHIAPNCSTYRINVGILVGKYMVIRNQIIVGHNSLIRMVIKVVKDMPAQSKLITRLENGSTNLSLAS